MKYTKTSALLAALLTVGSAQAITIDLGLSKDTSRSTTDQGTIAVTTSTTISGGASQTSAYSVTGLTLDSNGSGDDSITFSLGLTGTSSASGGTVTGFGTSYGAWGVIDGVGSNSLVEAVETLQFTFVGATVSLGAGATESATIAFDGFTGFYMIHVQPDEKFDISTTSGNSDATDVPGVQQDYYTLTGGLENDFTIIGNTGAMRYREVATSLTVTVPESSSSLILLGLSVLGLGLFRHKFAR